MRIFELIAAVFAGLIVLVVLQVVGVLLKFAIMAAVVGFVTGLLIARSLRRSP